MLIMRYQRRFNLPTQIVRMRLLEERFCLVDRGQLAPVWHATGSTMHQRSTMARAIIVASSETPIGRAMSGTRRLEGETRCLKLWLRPPSATLTAENSILQRRPAGISFPEFGSNKRIPRGQLRESKIGSVTSTVAACFLPTGDSP